MTDHTIVVTLSPDGSKLIPNPGQNPLVVAAGDTVAWNLPKPNLHIRFVSFVPSGHSPGANQGNSPFAERGTVQPAGPNTVDPHAERGLYCYMILDSQGNALEWQDPLFRITSGGFSAFLAGIEKPIGPP
jgi:hypothetical protein